MSVCCAKLLSNLVDTGLPLPQFQIPLTRRQVPGDVVYPAYGVDVLLYGALLQYVVPQVQHGQLVVDEDGLWQELQVAVGQVC